MSNSEGNQSKNKILFLGTQMAVGGAQQVLFSQASWFHKRGYSVSVAFFYDKENLNTQWDEKYPYPIIDLQAWQKGKNVIANIFSLFFGMIRLWKLFHREKISIVETFTPDSNMLGLLIARLAGVPVRIATHHGVIEGRPHFLMRLHGWMVNQNFANLLVAVSERVQQIAIEDDGIMPEKVKVILNGIEPLKPALPSSEIRKQLQTEVQVPPFQFIVLSVGRVTAQKGQIYLLRAIPDILECFPDTVFLIAGEGPLRKHLQAEAVKMGVDQYIHFLGTRSDIPDLLSVADLFVMPSLSEGMPIALLEAMDMSVPVVVSNLEQISAFVTHKQHGLLVEPKDVSALTNSIVLMLDDKPLREKLGSAGQALVRESYTLDRMCQQYEQLFIREIGV